MRNAPVHIADIASASQRAKTKVRDMIRRGEIASGQRIDQRLLAKKLGLTTAPLREALCSLETEGLLFRVPGVGIFCKAYTVGEIEQMIEIRGVLEGLAARRLVTRLTDAAKKQLYSFAEEISDEVFFKSQEDFIIKHVRFHASIAEFSQSDYLQSLLERDRIIEQVLSKIAASIWPVRPHDHIELVNAICSGQPELAEKTMRDHIAPTYVERLNLLREKYGNNPIM